MTVPVNDEDRARISMADEELAHRRASCRECSNVKIDTDMLHYNLRCAVVKDITGWKNYAMVEFARSLGGECGPTALLWAWRKPENKPQDRYPR